MRDTVREFVRTTIGERSLQEPVYEFGSYQVSGQEKIANMRPLFSGLEFVGCDMRIGTGVDYVMNLHNLAIRDNVVGTVLCLDTLEHVELCRQAVNEMHRILKPGGLCLLSSVMNFRIHSYPRDYWRFTPQGFDSLLNCFQSRRVTFLGNPSFPRTIFGIGEKAQHENITR